MNIEVELRCDVGCLKACNEDMVLAGGELFRDRSTSLFLEAGEPGRSTLLAVADGMGGYSGGARASEVALTRLRDLWSQLPGDLSVDELREVLTTWAAETHEELRATSPGGASRAGMGTTIVALAFYGDRVFRCHAGDSRLYRWRGKNLELLTRDHSLREMRSDPTLPANLLTNSLGGGDSSWLEFSEVDTLKSFDRFLLCSDGLHALVDDCKIAQALAADIETAANTLMKLARGCGGDDNISVIVAELGRCSTTRASA
jgi:protein phosphatase